MSHWDKAFFVLFILIVYWDNRDMRKRIQKLETAIAMEKTYGKTFLVKGK
jgi:hypothetical protein